MFRIQLRIINENSKCKEKQISYENRKEQLRLLLITFVKWGQEDQ